ncbi:amidohydrolase family protein [Tunturiibacter gelidiferens]|uniref:amidohydrolase family protein n=1 Tax=Tunturiibacter gelidiferens TaxID=3069689 RepID=UPI003D9ABCDD
MASQLSTALRRIFVLLAILTYPAFAANPRLLIRNARIMTMASNQREPINGYLSVASDGTILAVAAGEPPATLHADKIIDAHGDLMIPGFISAHSHLWQAAYRGLAADKTLPGWIDDLYGVHASKASPEDMYWFALLGSLDHLEHGITTAYNFTYGGRANPRTQQPVRRSPVPRRSRVRHPLRAQLRPRPHVSLNHHRSGTHAPQSLPRLDRHSTTKLPLPQRHDQRHDRLQRHLPAGRDGSRHDEGVPSRQPDPLH